MFLYVEVDRLELEQRFGAAKGEVSVMIIEKNNCLGGLATTGLVTTFAGSSIFSDSEDDDPVCESSPGNQRCCVGVY